MQQATIAPAKFATESDHRGPPRLQLVLAYWIFAIVAYGAIALVIT